MLEPQMIHNVTHPFIGAIYLKRGFDRTADDGGTDILVIEARRTVKQASKKERSQLFQSFLADLDLIKDQVESKAGRFKRIDIKYS